MTPLYTEAPNSIIDAIRTADEHPIVFLAGGITNCPDWQRLAGGYLTAKGLSVYNPRRADFDVTDKAVEREQIAWEFRAMHAADLVLFWFTEGPSVQPITLYELGRHAALGKPIAVGTHPEYLRRTDVVEQMRHARPMITVREGLAHTCDDAVRYLRVLSRS